MKLFRRLIAISLSLTLMITLCVPVFSMNHPSENTDLIYLNADGIFESYDSTADASARALSQPLSVTGGRNHIYSTQDSRYFSKIDDTQYIELNKVLVDITSLENIQLITEEYSISDAVAARLIKLYEENINGTQTVTQVEVYTPVGINARSSRTYTGYGGLQYSEEIVTWESYSDWVEAFESRDEAFNNYLKDVVPDTIMGLFAIGADYITKGGYSLVALGFPLIPKAEYSTNTHVHNTLLNQKYSEKMTFVHSGGVEYIGSTTAFVSYYFEEELRYGYKVDPLRDSGDEVLQNTPYYYNADELAYYHFQNGGQAETFESVEHFFQTYKF